MITNEKIVRTRMKMLYALPVLAKHRLPGRS